MSDQQHNTPFRGKSNRDELSPDDLDLPVSQKRQCLDRNIPLVDPTEVKERVMQRVNEALIEVRSQTSHATGISADLIAEIVTPLVTAITSSMCDVLHKAVNELRDRDEERSRKKSSDADTALMAKLRVLTYKNDSLEQYSRRENVRIHGLEETAEREVNLEKRVLGLLQKAGTQLTEKDIAACHRTGKPRNGSRPVLVRFVSRKSKVTIMKSKRNLKDKNPRVFINDDLTSLRSRLLGYIKSIDNVEKAWTIDGRIYCIKKLPPGVQRDPASRPIVIDSPDDLFNKLGIVSVDFQRLGLSHLA